jgi:hypothetical protein
LGVIRASRHIERFAYFLNRTTREENYGVDVCGYDVTPFAKIETAARKMSASL